MREKTDLSDLDDYYVKITRKHPVSEEHVPVGELLRAAHEQAPSITPAPAHEQPAAPAIDLYPLIQRIAAIEERAVDPPMVAPQPPPPQIDMGLVEARVAQMIRDAIEALPPPPLHTSAHQSAPPTADMPAFMQRLAAERGISAPPQGPDVGDAIAAVNDIETRVLTRLDELARRFDRLESRLDMAPEPFTQVETSDSVKVIEDYLRSIAAQAEHAEHVAAALAARQTELEKRLASRNEPEAAPAQPAPEPALPAPDRKTTAMARIREAAEGRRNELIGPSADSRDVRHRLVELALNAAHGHAASIDLLRRLAEVQGIEWDGLRKALVEQHDVATAVVVQTAAAESWAAIRLSTAAEPDIDRIVGEAIRQIEQAGG